MNIEIDINKMNKSITFQNRGIGFTQLGIAKEILDLIDDLQQENKQLKSILTELEEWLEMMEEKETIGTYSMVQDKIQELKEKYK